MKLLWITAGLDRARSKIDTSTRFLPIAVASRVRSLSTANLARRRLWLRRRLRWGLQRRWLSTTRIENFVYHEVEANCEPARLEQSAWSDISHSLPEADFCRNRHAAVSGEA